MAQSTESRQPNVEPGRSSTTEVYLYLGVLSFFLLIPGSLIWTPLQFIYSDVLHMSAPQVAVFKLIINVPGYVGFLIGMIRDRCNPLKMGDRGFIVIGSLICSSLFFAIALGPLSVTMLGIELIAWAFAGGIMGAAFTAMMRNIAEARRMTGRMSTLSNFSGALFGAIMLLAGGAMFDHMPWQRVLFVVAGVYIVIAGVALWRPQTILRDATPGGTRSFAQMAEDMGNLLRFRGYWIAFALWVVWAFGLVGVTPVQFYIKNTLHSHTPGTDLALFNAFFSLTSVPAILLFGFLCKKMSLWRLLLISTVVAIPQWLPAAYIHTMGQLLAVATFAGFTGGLATTAYTGLLFRAVPRELAATGMLFATGLGLLGAEAGNVAGGVVLQRMGFVGCAVGTTLVYGLLFPLCFLLPRALVAPADDERVPTEQELLGEPG